MLQHQPQRLRSLGIVRAAAGPGLHQSIRTLRQVAAQIPGAVAGRVAAVGEPLAEARFRLDDDGVLAAVEEKVVVLGGEREASAGVEAEGCDRAAENGMLVLLLVQVVAVVDVGGAAPHGRVGDEEVGVGVVDGGDRVVAGWSAEDEAGGVGANEHAAVVGAAAAVVDAEGVADGDDAARGAAEVGLGGGEGDQDGEENGGGEE